MNRGVLSLEGVAAEASRALSEAQSAQSEVRKVRNGQLDQHQQLGAVARELAAMRGLIVDTRKVLEGKMDACIEDVRSFRDELRKARPKLDSFSEMEPQLREVSQAELASHKRKRALSKWGRRAFLTFVLSAAGVAGAAGAATLLKDCSHGRIVVPEGNAP